MEVLHTLILGPYKYLLRAKMATLSTKQCMEVAARVRAFPSSGLSMKVSTDISKYYRSFVGRDFKAFAQIALFVISPYLTASETKVWLALSKVSYAVACLNLTNLWYFNSN